MASAVLGNAARRLGGRALRQVQVQAAGTFPKLSPAVELGQQRVSPRFIHTEQQQQASSICVSGTKPGNDGLLGKIQVAKEELYQLMTEANKTHQPGGDKKLFQCLSGYVQPRPHDPTWKSNMSSRRLDAIFRGVAITNTVAVCSALTFVSALNMATWMRS